MREEFESPFVSKKQSSRDLLHACWLFYINSRPTKALRMMLVSIATHNTLPQYNYCVWKIIGWHVAVGGLSRRLSAYAKMLMFTMLVFISTHLHFIKSIQSWIKIRTKWNVDRNQKYHYYKLQHFGVNQQPWHVFRWFFKYSNCTGAIARYTLVSHMLNVVDKDNMTRAGDTFFVFDAFHPF